VTRWIAIALLLVLASCDLSGDDAYPITIDCVRMDTLPFPPGEVVAQLRSIRAEWRRGASSLCGLRIHWRDVDVSAIEAGYMAAHAGVPYRGASHVWQTALAHEAAHYLLRPDRGHPIDVFGPHGVVERARHRAGKP